MIAAPRLPFVHIVAALPAWMIADGEYSAVAVGRTAEFGFALEPELVEVRPAAEGFEQAGAPVPTTTLSGHALTVSSEAPTVVQAGDVHAVLVDAPPAGGGTVVARGRLVVEPFLWAVDGVLWPLVPDGIRLWSVDRIREAGSTVEDLDGVPSAAAVDHDAVYLLHLSRPSITG